MQTSRKHTLLLCSVLLYKRNENYTVCLSIGRSFNVLFIHEVIPNTQCDVPYLHMYVIQKS